LIYFFNCSKHCCYVVVFQASSRYSCREVESGCPCVPGLPVNHTRVTMTNDTMATTLRIYDTSSKMLFFYSNVLGQWVKYFAPFSRTHCMLFLCPRHSKNGGGALSVTPVRSCVRASVRPSVIKSWCPLKDCIDSIHIWYAYIKHQNTGQVRFGLQTTNF